MRDRHKGCSYGKSKGLAWRKSATISMAPALLTSTPMVWEYMAITTVLSVDWLQSMPTSKISRDAGNLMTKEWLWLLKFC